jgi:hypothetical protein
VPHSDSILLYQVSSTRQPSASRARTLQGAGRSAISTFQNIPLAQVRAAKPTEPSAAVKKPLPKQQHSARSDNEADAFASGGGAKRRGSQNASARRSRDAVRMRQPLCQQSLHFASPKAVPASQVPRSGTRNREPRHYACVSALAWTERRQRRGWCRLSSLPAPWRQPAANIHSPS